MRNTSKFVIASLVVVFLPMMSSASAQNFLTVPEFSACASLQTMASDLGNRNQELDRYNDSWNYNLNRRSADEVSRYNVSVGRQNELSDWVSRLNTIGNANCNNVSFNVADVRIVCNVSHDQMSRYLNNSKFCDGFRSKYPMTSHHDSNSGDGPVVESAALRIGGNDLPDEVFVLEWVDAPTSIGEFVQVPSAE